MSSTNEALAALGRAVVADGRLRQLQIRIQFSMKAMSELLYVAPATYQGWIERPGVTLWPDHALRIGRLYREALQLLQVVQHQGVVIDELMPLHQVAMEIGRPLEVLMAQYRAGDIDCEDLEVLGLWMPLAELGRLKGERRGLAA